MTTDSSNSVPQNSEYDDGLCCFLDSCGGIRSLTHSPLLSQDLLNILRLRFPAYRLLRYLATHCIFVSVSARERTTHVIQISSEEPESANVIWVESNPT